MRQLRIAEFGLRNRPRAIFIVALVAGVLSVTLAAFAQEPQGKVPRVGFLISETLSGQASRIEALRAGLRDRGYIEGKNIVIEVRSADGNYDRLPDLAAELTRLKVDVLVPFGTKATLAARRVTTTIPIIVPVIGNPVAMGLASSLAQPQGNITGSATFGLELSSKRMEFIKETVPHIGRVAWVTNPASATSDLLIQPMSITAKSLRLDLQRFEVPGPKEIERTFSAMAKRRVNAIVLSTDTLFQANARPIADLAAKQRIPSVGAREFAEAGGLIGYGPNDAEQYRRGAYFVDRILKGAKPADLPIERPTKFELVINMKTANALGIKIPQSILNRADRVID